MKAAQSTFEHSDFFQDFLRTWTRIFDKKENKEAISKIICLGLGNFAQNPHSVSAQIASKFQLSFLLALLKTFSVQGHVFDPVLTKCEKEILTALGFETPEEGYLAKILIQAGTKDIAIGKPLCIIVSDKSSISQFENYEPLAEGSAPAAEPVAAAPPPPAAKSSPPPPPVAKVAPLPTPAAAAGSSDRAFASPAAKKLAAEKGINLSQIAKGSGMDGMITSKDVENLPTSVASPSAAVSTPATGAAIPSGPRYGGMPAMMDSSHTDADISSMRKTIAKRLQSSKHEIPHYYLTVECQVDNLMKLRGELNTQYKDEGIKLSVNDFIIK